MNQYEAFAKDFARTRSRPWEFLVDVRQELIHSGILKQYEIAVDLGCGNGQNSILFRENFQTCLGLDLSWQLLCMAKSKYLNLIQADVGALPFRSETFDFGYSIAVLHHIIGREYRRQVVNEMKRVLKVRGHLFLTVWRRWQGRFAKHFLREGFHNAAEYFPAGLKEFGDVNVGWDDSKTNTRYPRLYHLFTRTELRNLLTPFQVLYFTATGHKRAKTNFVAFLQR